MRIDISRALAIEGWMSPGELEWLAREARRHRRIVEVGSFRGRSTRALADHTPGIVWAVDDWSGGSAQDRVLQAQVRRGVDPTLERREAEPLSAVRESFHKNLWDQLLPATGHVRAICDSSVGASHRFMLSYLDMVFLDGSHDRDSVLLDIQMWSNKIREGGILCGHDYDESPYHEVKAVVDELFGPGGFEVFETIWWRIM